MSSEHRSSHFVLPWCFALMLFTVAPANGSASPVNLWKFMAEQTLEVSDSEIIQINTPAVEASPFQASFPLAGQTVTLSLTPHSVRCPDFKLLIANADGTLTEADPGPVCTMRGQLTNVPGSVATGSILPSGLRARIKLPNGKAYGLIALRRMFPSADSGLYALYDESNSTEAVGQCGAVPEFPRQARRQNQGTGVACESVGPFLVRLGCDTNPDFVNTFPGDTWQQKALVAEEFIEGAVNDMNCFVYEVQLNTTHCVPRIMIRDDTNDIYENLQNDTQVLNALSNEWRTNLAEYDVDLAALWLSLDLPGHLAGSAYRGSICGPGVCWMKKSFGSGRLFLLAHEAGHVWGAGHCNQVEDEDDVCTTCAFSCAVMRSTFSGCDGLSFTQCSLDEIIARRNTAQCGEDLGLTPPLLSIGGLPLDEGDTVTFDEVLTGETSARVFQLENRLNCELPVFASVVGAGAPFRISEPVPSPIPPLSTVNFAVEFSADFAGSYAAGLRIRASGLFGGADFTVNLEASAGVGSNLPTRPELLCPLNWATTPQPEDVFFTWSQAEFVESFEIRIMKDLRTDQIAFRQTDLKQVQLRPAGLVLTPGTSYSWFVIAHNANGSLSSPLFYNFTVDPDNTGPIMEVTYANNPVQSGDTLNLPLNPDSFVFDFDFHNSGPVPLLIDHLKLPDNFTGRWVKPSSQPDDVGPSIDFVTMGRIPACSSQTLRLKSTLTIPQLLQTNTIMDTLEFDTNDPNAPPHYVINLCFRCDAPSSGGMSSPGSGGLTP